MQDPPKFTQIGIFGSKRNHLATLVSMSKQQLEHFNATGIFGML
jgi:hypothetical protein